MMFVYAKNILFCNLFVESRVYRVQLLLMSLIIEMRDTCWIWDEIFVGFLGILLSFFHGFLGICWGHWDRTRTENFGLGLIFTSSPCSPKSVFICFFSFLILPYLSKFFPSSHSISLSIFQILPLKTPSLCQRHL